MITFHEAPWAIPGEDTDWWPAIDDRAKAKRWCTLSSVEQQRNNYEGWSETDRLKWNPPPPALTSDERREWLVLDGYFLSLWIGRLRRGTFVAEGCRFGETALTEISREFWQRTMFLDMWRGTAEWNGIKYVELKVGRPAPTPATVSTPVRIPLTACPQKVFDDYVSNYRAEHPDRRAPSRIAAEDWARERYSLESVRTLHAALKNSPGRPPKGNARK